MAVPQIDEQEANVARAEELSAGRRLQRADLPRELLRDKVEAVATDDETPSAFRPGPTRLGRSHREQGNRR